MSSLHQDHLLVEGPEPVTGPFTLASARGTARRPAGEKATTSVPTQRQGKSQRTGSTRTTAAGSTSSATAKAAGAKAATAKATTVKAATAGAASARSATAKPATAKPAPAAKPASCPKAKAAAEPAVTAPEAEKVATARPTPYKRTATAEPEVVVEAPTEAVASEVVAGEVVASIAEGRRSFLRRRPPSIRRRPALYLAAALVGAISISGASGGEPIAQATDTMSHSVSVAEELGITAEPTAAVTDTHAAERLGELAVSRNERGAEQAAAAQAQAAADQAAVQAAAEAARPKAVLPVTGARLTSTFGPRWGTLHAGIDLAAPMRTPEMAAMDGVVLEAGPASGFGLAVYIQHENGDVTVYGHMDEILVQAGQVVRAGDTIALLGNRGQSTGPHLHFEVHVGGINGQKIDPLPWLRERGIAI